jgi:hypothetical protein
MNQYPSTPMLSILLALLTGLGLSSCIAYDQPYGPGYAHTPPPPSVVFYSYWYYPDIQVYFDSTGKCIFITRITIGSRQEYCHHPCGHTWVAMSTFNHAITNRISNTTNIAASTLLTTVKYIARHNNMTITMRRRVTAYRPRITITKNHSSNHRR